MKEVHSSRRSLRRSSTHTTLLLILLLSTSLAPALAQPEGQHHRRPDDIKEYLARLDSPERDSYQRPLEVMQALDLKPGMSVADLGSGSGYFTRRFLKAVTDTGKVYAIDVEPEMLSYVKNSLGDPQASKTVSYILAAPDDPKLSPGSVDLIFLCNTYHHLEDRSSYFAKVKPALTPAGRIVIIDFYHDERSGEVNFPRRHLVARDTVVADMAKAGYELAGEHTFLTRQYFLEFTPQ